MVASSREMGERIAHVRSRIADAAARAGRSADDILLIGVSKFQPVEAILEAHDLGIRTFGENRVQERAEKAPLTSSLDASWHMIGHLQRNKARRAAELFDMIQSVDSAELATSLDRHVRELGRAPLPVMIEVNTSGEASKSGTAPDDCKALADMVMADLGALELRGLMTIGPLEGGEAAARASFAALRELGERISAASGRRMLLSMGMTGDFEAAIMEGSDIVRVGTGIFGPRG